MQTIPCPVIPLPILTAYVSAQDTVLLGGKTVTVDSAERIIEALATRDSRDLRPRLGDWVRARVPVGLDSDRMIGLDPNHAMNAFNSLVMLSVTVSCGTPNEESSCGLALGIRLRKLALPKCDRSDKTANRPEAKT